MKYIKEGMAEGAEKFEAEDNDMKECRQLFQELITENLVQIICSNTRDADRAAKAKIRPVQIKEKLMFQETLYREHRFFTAILPGKRWWTGCPAIWKLCSDRQKLPATGSG